MKPAPTTSLTLTPSTLGALRPTRATVTWRTSVLWQLIRFVVINLRISQMILRSHDTRLEH